MNKFGEQKRERDIDLKGTRQRALERNSRNILEDHSDERIFRRRVSIHNNILKR